MSIGVRQFAAVAMTDALVLGGIAVAILAALVVSLVFFHYGTLWLQAYMSGAAVRMMSVVVTVLEIRGNKARFGIDAPEDLHVLRSELLDRVSVASGIGSRATVAPTESCDPRGIDALETEGISPKNVEP